MTVALDTEPISYSSIFRHGVDEKRRVQIPAKWRPASQEITFSLILWPHAQMNEACILVLPPAEWRTLVDKLKAMPFADPKAQALRRLLGKKSAQVSLDSAGRICLPEEMTHAIEVEKDAVLVGLLDRFQIWSPDRYRTVSEQDEQLAAEAFQLLS